MVAERNCYFGSWARNAAPSEAWAGQMTWLGLTWARGGIGASFGGFMAAELGLLKPEGLFKDHPPAMNVTT